MPSNKEIARLLETLAPRLLRVVASYRIPRHEGEDLVQEAFMALIQQAENIRNPEAWLVFVVKRQCLMHLRRKRRQITDAVDSAILEAVAEASQDRPEDRLFRTDLESVLATLSPKCQELLRARYLEEQDTECIAERFGYKESSVRKLCARCLEKLVDSFGQQTGERSYRNVL